MNSFAIKNYEFPNGTTTYKDFEFTGRWYIEDSILYIETRFDYSPRFIFKIFGMRYRVEIFIHEENILDISFNEELKGKLTSEGIMTGRMYYDLKGNKAYSIKPNEKSKNAIWYNEKDFGIIQECEA